MTAETEATHAVHRTTRRLRTNSDGTSDEISGSVPGSSDFAVNGGGGLRFYVNQRLGFRMEAKVYRPTGTFNNAFGKIEGGFFIQFR